MTHPLSLSPICGAAMFLFAAAGVSLLAQDAPGSPPPDTPRERTDRHGDPLPEGAITRLGTLRFRSESICDSVSYSSDGEFIVTDGPNNSIIIWDSATGSRIRTISG
ncbi:MAG: hypothetical protein O6952_03040, partial [Planctomycetota bacterium]|nr:hypothetical protein [Planctomycetota bacterium]